MSKILKRMQFNNGYGCSCHRQDWEESEWIDESEMPTIKDFFENNLNEFDKNCNRGGCVGITYEKDGMVLFGVEATIYKAYWFFEAIKEDEDAYLTHSIHEQHTYKGTVFDLNSIWEFYGLGNENE